MKELVRKMGRNFKCGIYACKKRAKYSIGHEAIRMEQLYVCEDCFREIVRQGQVLLEEIDTNETRELDTNNLLQVGVNEVDGFVAEEVGKVTELEDGKTITLQQDESPNVVEGSQILADMVGETAGGSVEVTEAYTCKYCEETFVKPDEKMKYVSHMNQCAKNPKNMNKMEVLK